MAPAKKPKLTLKEMTLSQRIREADGVHTLFRDDEEIEVGVYGEWQRAEPDVGIMNGYYEVHSAFSIATGEDVTLTDDEISDIQMKADEDQRDY